MPSAPAASRRTPAGVRATGVEAVAGSPGQPVPGGAGLTKYSPVTGCGACLSMPLTLTPTATPGLPMREDPPMARVTVVGGGVVGLTTAQPKMHESPAQLLVQADEMLYQAKQEGRNRIKGANLAANP